MTPRDVTSEIPKETANSLNETALEKTHRSDSDLVNERVEHLEGLIQDNQKNTENVKRAINQLQDRVDNQSINDQSAERRYQSICSMEGSNQGSPKIDTTHREREVDRKGIERLQKQIYQLNSVQIFQENTDIALLKKCKMVNVPAMNTDIGDIQGALQKYVSFKGVDAEFCDEVENLMDKAQLWCLNIKDLCNKTEVHSINTSKGDAADVGIFSDNSQTTVFEFLEAAELTYLGWGNSVQKANRLYNKHLSEAG